MEVPIIIQNMSNIDDSHTDKLNIIISLLENMKKKKSRNNDGTTRKERII